MNRLGRFTFVVAFGLLAFAFRSPAPLTYQPGEGWTYETAGKETGKWQRARAKDQLDVAQEAFDKKDFDTARKAALRCERLWPLSDYTPKAQYLVGRCYEEQKNDEKAFKAYQRLIEHSPKADNYQEILQRQIGIANRYLDGQWFKAFNYIPFFPNMDKTAGMYEKIIKSGPYSDVAAQAQIKLGEAREKQAEPKAAVKAYQTAADRFSDRPAIAADALWKTGLAYKKQCKSAEYDSNLANQAIASFTDFITLFPQDTRVTDAQKFIGELKTEAARGNIGIAQYYEKNHKWAAARVYYNEAVTQDPSSELANQARARIAQLNAKLGDQAEAPAPAVAPAATEPAPAPVAEKTETPVAK
ncbi:MAG: hypothetical protein RLZZ350_185 [Verrucomicrobiota bacterium]